jgi:hypothetical protein
MRITSALRLIPVFGMRYSGSKTRRVLEATYRAAFKTLPVSQDATMKLVPGFPLSPAPTVVYSNEGIMLPHR